MGGEQYRFSALQLMSLPIRRNVMINLKNTLKKFFQSYGGQFFLPWAAAALAAAVMLKLLVFPENSAATAAHEGVFLPIIMYHSVCDSRDLFGEYVISPQTLENDLRYLKENGYTSVFVRDLVNFVHCGGELPPKPVVITFDDGFYNTLSVALPLLEKYDMKATVSVVGSYCEKADGEISRSDRYSYLGAKDISQLFNSGRIEIANHTFDLHKLGNRRGAQILPGESYEDYRSLLISDLMKTQDYLSDNCSIAPTVFAYPYGIVSEPSLRIVKSCGFSASLGVEERPNYITADPECLYRLNRYNRPYGMSTEEFMKKLLKE